MHLALYNGLNLWYNITMTTRKRKKVKQRDPIAKDLRTPKYRMRVVKSKKLYKRKDATLLIIELEN